MACGDESGASAGPSLLDADVGRLDGVITSGLDEIGMFQCGRYRCHHWGTTIVDTRRGVLLGIAAGRSAEGAT